MACKCLLQTSKWTFNLCDDNLLLLLLLNWNLFYCKRDRDMWFPDPQRLEVIYQVIDLISVKSLCTKRLTPHSHILMPNVMILIVLDIYNTEQNNASILCLLLDWYFDILAICRFTAHIICFTAWHILDRGNISVELTWSFLHTSFILCSNRPY